MRLEHLLSGALALVNEDKAYLRFASATPWLPVLQTLFNGGLAQLARALAWHARGHRFDPDILHIPLERARDL